MSLLPFDQRDGIIWLDGKFVPWKDAQVHVLTHSLHYGAAVFEGERAYGGNVFKLKEHGERFVKSASLVGYELPFSAEQIDQAVKELVAKQNLKDAYIRRLAWRGSEQMAVAARKAKIHVMVAAWDWPSMFSLEAKAKGIRLIWSKWKRPSPETAPVAAKASGLYMICTLSKHAAENAGYDDALMLDYRGYLAEATGANLFLVMKNGEIHTPIADCFLNGITRQTIIQLARDLGYTVIERHIKPEELKDAKEVFLTGSAAEVSPVGEIEGVKFTPGDTSMTLVKAYDALVRSNGKKAAA